MELITYSEYCELFKGMTVHIRRTGKELDRASFYWDNYLKGVAFFEQIRYDFSNEFRLLDKPEWLNGIFVGKEYNRKENSKGLRVY